MCRIRKTCILFIIILAVVCTVPQSSPQSDMQTEGSAEEFRDVLRLHILADSDSENAQKEKLAARDKLLEILRKESFDSENDAKVYLETNKEHIVRTLAATELKISKEYYPIRLYQSESEMGISTYVFPPGYYDSCVITMGEGEGHNWWCLIYPDLCITDGCKIQSISGTNENKDTKPVIKWKIIELLKKIPRIRFTFKK